MININIRPIPDEYDITKRAESIMDTNVPGKNHYCPMRICCLECNTTPSLYIELCEGEGFNITVVYAGKYRTDLSSYEETWEEVLDKLELLSRVLNK